MIEIFYFDKTVKKGTAKDLNKLKNKQLWIDSTNITKKEVDLIKETFSLHPLTAEDLYSSKVRVKVEEFPDYLFCVFYGIQKTKTIEMVELDFIIGKNFLITHHKKGIESYSLLKNSRERLKNLFRKGNDFLFHRLLDMEIDNYSPVLETVDDRIEAIEEKVTKHPKPELLTRVLKLKRLLVQVKKIVFPQREKISFLAKNEYRFLSKKSIPYFRDIYDHSIRVSDAVDNYREAISNTFDAYMSAVSNSMNEVMKVLSIIATIALPLTVISGIYGTNFAELPGSGFAYGFWVMILGMVLLSLFMVYYFKRKSWF